MMNIDDEVEKRASRMADLIVELVERTDGPVTLARIHREIQGFAKEDPHVWQYYLERDDGEQIIWDGMTEAGLKALNKVMCGRRVAIQYLTSQLLYLIDGCYHRSENWVPIVLLPAKAANVDTPNWLVRGSPAFQKHCIARAAAGVKGYRWLTPGPVRHTADQFSM
jgi:hypothetical protein